MSLRTAQQVVMERSGGVCEVCGRSRAHQYHHRQARAMGGSLLVDVPSNLVHLCAGCHRAVEAYPKQSVDAGLKVLHGQSSRDTPVRLQHGLVRLYDDGTLEIVT